MASPYPCRTQFFLEGTSTEVFGEIDRVEYRLNEGDSVYFDGVGYKVESEVLYLDGESNTNPVTGVTKWCVVDELYKIQLSLLP